MATMLETLVAMARKEGWAAGSGSIAQIRREAQSLGWTEVSVRQGAPTVTTLRPLNRDDAQANSLSAKYGIGDQPLHTDGAHLANPPDVVVLVCEGTSDTPTRLWKMKRSVYVPIPPDHMRHGVFLVANGKDSFFSTAYSYPRFRYDAGCMVPCDARARETVRYFEAAMESVIEHSWDEPGKILVIDNRKALHARASAINDPHREVQRVSFYLKPEAS
jgi:Taurine catabolism dioxygenase TauD, TfdA family